MLLLGKRSYLDVEKTY